MAREGGNSVADPGFSKKKKGPGFRYLAMPILMLLNQPNFWACSVKVELV